MGYDLYWVNDPHETERQERVKCFMENTSNPFEAVARMYDVAAEDGAYFRASQGVMAAVRHELQNQGLDEFAEYFVRNTGTVAPDVIFRALAAIRDHTTMPADVSNPFDDWFNTVIGRESGGQSGGEALMDAPPGTWQQKWAEFVRFLRSAAQHGGISVT